MVTAGLTCCTLIAQCATGVQPQPAARSVQVRQHKPAFIHTHTVLSVILSIGGFHDSTFREDGRFEGHFGTF